MSNCTIREGCQKCVDHHIRVCRSYIEQLRVSELPEWRLNDMLCGPPDLVKAATKEIERRRVENGKSVEV